MLVPDAALEAALAARAGGRPLPQRLAPGGGPRAVAATRLTQLTRLTVATGDPGEAAAALGPGGPLRAAGWGLVAVRPLSDRVLAAAASSLDVDIIAFDLSTRPPFKLAPKVLAAAVKRGIALELRYAPALAGDAPRRAWLTHGALLAGACRGSGGGIVLSSGAARGDRLRGPRDAAALGQCCGLTAAAALSSVSAAPAAIVRAAQERREAVEGLGVEGPARKKARA